jgi:translation elongation factor EF-Tu-like GTPase
MKKWEGKKPQETRGTGPSDYPETPLAAAISKQLAKREETPTRPFNLTGKTPGEKEQGVMIAFWKCFNLNKILLKYIHYLPKEESEEESANGE